MIRILLIVLGVSLCISEPSFAQDTSPESAPWDNTAEDSVGPVVAFVGEKILVEKRNLELSEEVTLPDGQTVNRIIPRMANRFELRYKIIDVIAGNYKGSEIDFETFRHSGNPIFPKLNPVGLSVINRDGKWVLLGQSSVFLPFETTDGDWAICGSLARPEWSEDLQALAATYEEPMGFLDIPNTQAAAKACATGTRAANIFAFQEETQFAPQRRRWACNREMRESGTVKVGRWSTLDREFMARDHAACVSRLEAEDNL